MESLAVAKQAESKKAHNVKLLPPALAALTAQDHEKFVIVLENDPNPKSTTYSVEFRVVSSIKLSTENDLDANKSFDIQERNIDQIRQMCRNLGVVNIGCANKFHCRRAIAGHSIDYMKALRQEHGLAPSSQAARIPSTICRAVNVIFSSSYIEDFLTVNNRKARVDHETRNTYCNGSFGSGQQSPIMTACNPVVVM